MHAHDWPTAPVAFGDLGGTCKSIFTIHNLNYGADLIGRAMTAAAAGTTVSPTYAAEVWLPLHPPLHAAQHPMLADVRAERKHVCLTRKATTGAIQWKHPMF